jgi:hypothetical protein
LIPNGAEDFEALGIAYYALKKDHDRATAYYTKAIELDARYALAYNGRGNVHVARRDIGAREPATAGSQP